ncbi:MAG: aldo/keto reductase [Chloroflexi bacterium]|nr:aldo/keto reductase [Chloroflexota bacterium]
MEYRTFGDTGIQVSGLGFGCGDVGGLIIRGTVQERVDAVARALDAGITYFDTASGYGRGQSEINLGAALRQLKASPVVGTKVRLMPEDLDDIPAAVARSVEASLARLGMERVDLIQLHNQIGPQRGEGQAILTPEDAVTVASAFEDLSRQGKAGAWGFTALGHTESLHAVVDSGRFNTAQTSYNILNPTSGQAVTRNHPYQDYGMLAQRAADSGMGIIAIRVLAAGALSGTTERHSLAAQSVAPIGTGADLASDAALAHRFSFLWEEGYAEGPVQAAIRFVVGNPAISTALVGYSSMEQLDYAIAALERGPLPGEALERLQAVREGMAQG